jgi:hypothetical protein
MAQVDLPKISYFRCHVGHQFGPQALAAAQLEASERKLWSSVAALEEQAAVLHYVQRHAPREQKSISSDQDQNAAISARYADEVASRAARACGVNWILTSQAAVASSSGGFLDQALTWSRTARRYETGHRRLGDAHFRASDGRDVNGQRPDSLQDVRQCAGARRRYVQHNQNCRGQARLKRPDKGNQAFDTAGRGTDHHNVAATECLASQP